MSLFEIADAIGLVTFSISGFLMGIRKRLDILGIVIAAFSTALGGGIIRDVVVGHTPIAFTKSSVLFFVIAGIIIALILKLHTKKQPERFSIFILMDSIGLVAFAITGALVGIEAQFNLFGIMLLAFITAVGGGMLRDIMVNEVPIVLTSDFYGTVALLIALLIYICDLLDYLGTFTLATIATVALFLRLVAYYQKWQLPKIKGKS